MKKFIVILSISVIALTSCKKDLPDVGGTAAQKMSGEWFVTFTVDDQDVYGLGHVKISTYNTAANNNTIWVDDLGSTWDFKTKAQADYNALTFNANQSDDVNNGIKVNIANGKVLPGAGVTKSGNVADSIYMEAEFSDDPGTKYVIKGHSRTGFFEDEY